MSKQPRSLNLTAEVDGSANLQLEAIAKGEVLASATGGIASATKELSDVYISPNARVRIKVSAKGSIGEPSEYTLSWSTTISLVPLPDPLDDDGADPDDGPAVLDERKDPADELE